MPSGDRSRVELMIAGLGGMGVLSAGRLLAAAGLQRYPYASFVPSYGTERRGGLSECTVILSDSEIASPIQNRVQSVLLLDGSQLGAFEDRVRPDGMIMADDAGLRQRASRGDLTVLPVSGLKIAMGLGGAVVNNMVMLGAYVGLVKPMDPELIEKQIRLRYAGKADVLNRNVEAFRRGLGLGRTLAIGPE